MKVFKDFCFTCQYPHSSISFPKTNLRKPSTKFPINLFIWGLTKLWASKNDEDKTPRTVTARNGTQLRQAALWPVIREMGSTASCHTSNPAWALLQSLHAHDRGFTSLEPTRLKASGVRGKKHVVTAEVERKAKMEGGGQEESEETCAGDNCRLLPIPAR